MGEVSQLAKQRLDLALIVDLSIPGNFVGPRGLSLYSIPAAPGSSQSHRSAERSGVPRRYVAPCLRQDSERSLSSSGEIFRRASLRILPPASLRDTTTSTSAPCCVTATSSDGAPGLPGVTVTLTFEATRSRLERPGGRRLAARDEHQNDAQRPQHWKIGSQADLLNRRRPPASRRMASRAKPRDDSVGTSARGVGGPPTKKPASWTAVSLPVIRLTLRKPAAGAAPTLIVTRACSGSRTSTDRTSTPSRRTQS